MIKVSMPGFARALLVATLAVLTTAAHADAWEDGPNGSDDSPGSVNVLLPYAPAQRHDLAYVGGVVDEDWFRVDAEANRAYDISIYNTNLDWFAGQLFELYDSDSTTLLQTAPTVDRGQYVPALRWIQTSSGRQLHVRVRGTSLDTAGSFYEIALRETTLYCPRFNNSSGQVSVLIVQRAGAERALDCAATAFFYDESQARCFCLHTR